MSKPNRVRRFIHQVAAWLLIAGFAYGVYRAYRWAEPSAASLAAVLNPAPPNPVNLELEDADFENFANGAKNWSLRARRILLARSQNGISNSLQTADIENISDGKLFALPVKNGRGEGERGRGGERTPAPVASSSAIPTTQASADANAGTPAATFSARHGRYTVGNSEGLPPNLLLGYTVQWQFRLTGDVQIRTRDGYQLNAPAITLLELLNRRSGKVERQMLCEQGAAVRAKGASVQANQARYDDKTQSVECLGGVRAVMQKDSVQGEHFFWSLKDNTIRCPDEVAGVWQDTQYTAQDVTIDARRHIYTGRKMVMQLNGKAASKLAMGSLSMVMATGAASQGPVKPSTPSVGTLSFAGAWHSEGDITIGHQFTYTSGKRVITGDNVRYDKGETKKTLDADGHLVMDDPDNHVIGERAHLEEIKGFATLTGNVVLTAKPDTSAPNDNAGQNSISGGKKQGAVVTCDQLDSFYRKKYTFLRGHVVFKQHILRPGKPPLDRTGTAEHAEYDGKKEILVLFPPVEGTDSDNSEFHSKENKVTIGTRSGKEFIEGVTGVVRTQIQEDDAANDDNTPPTAPPLLTGETKKTDTTKSDTPPAKSDTPKKNP